MSDSPLYLAIRVDMIKGGGGRFEPREGERHVVDVSLVAAVEALDAAADDVFAVWRVTESITTDQARSLIEANTPEALAVNRPPVGLLEMGLPPFGRQMTLHSARSLDPDRFYAILCQEDGCKEAQGVSRSIEQGKVDALLEEGGWRRVEGKGWFCRAHGGGT